MSATLQRRIKQLEKLVEQVANPEKPQDVVLLGTPGPDAPASEIEQFKADMRAAIARGAFVIVMVPLGAEATVEDGDQVKVVNHEWEGQLEVLARTPSRSREGQTALDDVIGGLSGNVIGTVPQEQIRRNW